MRKPMRKPVRKPLAAAAMVASLTLGGAAGVALFTPQLSSAQETDASTDATSADDTRAAETDGRRCGHRHHHTRLRHLLGGVVADALGVEPADLRNMLAGGMTLREVAEAEGVDPQVVVDAVVATAEERLDQAVADGRLTEEQAAEKLAEATERAEESLDRTFEGGPGPFGHGDRVGPDTEG